MLYDTKGALSVVSKVVRSRSNKKNAQNVRCPSCKSSSITIKLTFAPRQINKR